MEARLIEGRVNADLDALVSLPVKRRDGRYREIEFLIDTGVTGLLTLTPALVSELGLRLANPKLMMLADGSVRLIPEYYAEVVWDGKTKPVIAGALDSPPTIGTSLLDGYDLNIQFRDGGRILIQAGEHPPTARP